MSCPRERLILETEMKIVPIVQIDLRQGRPLEDKRRLVRDLTQVFVDTLQVRADNVQIIIREFANDNYARGGLLNADKK